MSGMMHILMTHDAKCLRIQIAAAPVNKAAVSTKHPVLLAALSLAAEQW